MDIYRFIACWCDKNNLNRLIRPLISLPFILSVFSSSLQKLVEYLCLWPVLNY